MTAERRQSPRYIVSIPSRVTTPAGQSYVCEILDLSETGCKIRLTETVQLWGPVTLSNEDEETFARVIWSEGNMAGLWFPNVVEEERETGFLRRVWDQFRRSGRSSDA